MALDDGEKRSLIDLWGVSSGGSTTEGEKRSLINLWQFAVPIVAVFKGIKIIMKKKRKKILMIDEDE